MPLTATQLFENLEAGGFGPQRLNSAGGEIIVTAYGGRLMGIFPEPTAPNLLWIPPAYETATGALHLRESGHWQLGGERLWLAPELELHFTDPANPCGETYDVPKDVDPGHWTIERLGDDGLKLSNRGQALNRVTQQAFTFQVERTLRMTESRKPKYTEQAIGLKVIVFNVNTRLQIDLEPTNGASYGLWNIAMVPAGGTMLIPIKHKPELVDYFQNDVAARCRIDANHIAMPITGETWHKLGLSVNDVQGHFGYWRDSEDGQATLIVREVETPNEAAYMDYPGHEPQRRDVLFQFYDDSGAFGRFGEFESHAPAANAATGFKAVDEHQTWCFSGDREKLRSFAAKLLDIDPTSVD